MSETTEWRHRSSGSGSTIGSQYCLHCGQTWTCDAERMRLENNRLLAVQAAARRALEMLNLTTTPPWDQYQRDSAIEAREMLAAALGEEAGQQPTPTDLAGLAGVDEQPLGEDA